jgi:hypothetical protein
MEREIATPLENPNPQIRVRFNPDSQKTSRKKEPLSEVTGGGSCLLFYAGS